ncbi:MAG: S9 family peptidase [Ignavibacteriota bacterium]
MNLELVDKIKPSWKKIFNYISLASHQERFLSIFFKGRSIMKVLNKISFVVFLSTLFFINFFLNAQIKNQSDFAPPPKANKIPVELTKFGQTRIDNYFWLKDKTNPDVIKYLDEENDYCEKVMDHTKLLQDKLFNEMKSRIKEDDESAPYLDNGYFYYYRTEIGKQYPIYCRKKGSLESEEEVIFDVNKMAENHPVYMFADYEISLDNRLAIYAGNTTGSYAEFTIRVKNLTTGIELPDVIEKISSFTVANDNKTLFYVTIDKALRPYQLYRYVIGSNAKPELLYEEKDEMFSLGVSKSKPKDWIFLESGSANTSEYRIINANKPQDKLQVFYPRQHNIEYYVYAHKDKFFILYKDSTCLNKKVFEVAKEKVNDRNNWKEIIPHNPSAKLESLDEFKDYLVVYKRENGLSLIEVYGLKDFKSHSIEFPEPVYSINRGYNPDFNSSKVRYNYSSLNRPTTTYDYDMISGTSTKVKEQIIPSGFNPEDYKVERIWAPAKDGKQVPISIVYKKDLIRNQKNPALIYAYGSYGYTSEAYFNSNIFSLIDRGFIYAIAHIRGGSELGESWFEDGRLLNKINSFTDFIACAEYLVQEKYTSPDYLTIYGGSAGGLLMGAVVNMRPDLFKTVIAAVPFVDVLTTMLDSSLPLTVPEYEQWGNPNEEKYYQYILSYSPYDNIKHQNYPNIITTAGLNDSQVLYHEPAKWVAKLRDYKTDDNILLFKTNMESGHGGATGRFDRLKEFSFWYAFLLDRLGINN